MTVTTKTRKTLTKKVATKVKKANSRVKTLAAGLVGKTRKNSCKNNSETCKNICIDYPQNNETVYCGHYCFRLGSRKPCSAMQVSINGGEWQNCRQANGYWWYDWWNFNTGNFYLEAKAYVDGKEEQTAKRKFKVTL
ncbi:MAG: hypothetical protein J6S61_02710 [Elusimicrobiaceae bacterium]|nr:hypothetical protein [Elusimicrobiaceae bacterium]